MDTEVKLVRAGMNGDAIIFKRGARAAQRGTALVQS